jgi:hypothetical protein
MADQFNFNNAAKQIVKDTMSDDVQPNNGQKT